MSQTSDGKKEPSPFDLVMMAIMARSILKEWASKKGQDRCHWHPDILKRLAEALKVEVDGSLDDLGPESEFRSGCKLFADQLYGVRGA